MNCIAVLLYYNEEVTYTLRTKGCSPLVTHSNGSLNPNEICLCLTTEKSVNCCAQYNNSHRGYLYTYVLNRFHDLYQRFIVPKAPPTLFPPEFILFLFFFVQGLCTLLYYHMYYCILLINQRAHTSKGRPAMVMVLG